MPDEPTIDHVPEPPPGADLPLDLLEPADKAGCLGRLGHYDILEVIGRGGMSVVFKGFDPLLRRPVAIKMLAPSRAASSLARQRFVREARAAAAINHDHVITIHAVEEVRGVPYLVMHHVSGQSLQQRLDEAGALELPDILHIGRQIAAGLAAAHGGGLIHRDIKPANILLESAIGHQLSAIGHTEEQSGPTAADSRQPIADGRVIITDFGLARAVDDASLSQTGAVAGTPLYMSPEQISGGVIDQRSDLYSLGVLLYRMATGREPFTGETIAALWSQHLFDRPLSPSEAAPGRVPAWLEELILRLLHKDAADRLQTAEEVIQAIDQHAHGAVLAPDETARLAALRRYKIMDSDPEQGFDDLTQLASHICGTPIALISLLDADRQWFLSKVGLSLKETARNISFCTHTIRETEIFLVPDALRDDRFANSPLVRADPHVRFYAGIPLISADGHALGALCVMDRVPRQLSPDQVTALSCLSRLVLTQLEMRRNLLEIKEALAESGRLPAPADKDPR